MEKYSVALASVVEELKFDKIYVPDNFDEIMVCKKEVNRPGLPLAGFFDHYDNERIQIMGKVEYHYLLDMTSEERKKRMMDFFEKGATALVISLKVEPGSYVSVTALFFQRLSSRSL